MCEIKDNPNDILLSGNIIVTFGKNFIEFLNFYQVEKNNDKKDNILEKKHEISINNNNNNINNNENNIIVNTSNQDEILCVELFNNIIICGHKSGFMSTWKPADNVYLDKLGSEQISQKSINKILLSKLSDGKDYLIICSSDKTIKIYSLEANKVIKEFNFEDEIMDIKLVNDYNNNKVFIISLKNGLLKVLDIEFRFLFKIYQREKNNKTRIIISLHKNEVISNEGNEIGYNNILITEGNNIDIYSWIKPGSFKQNDSKKPNNNYQQHNKNQKYNNNQQYNNNQKQINNQQHNNNQEHNNNQHHSNNQHHNNNQYHNQPHNRGGFRGGYRGQYHGPHSYYRGGK
mgnify:CR=1 FL=1